MATFKNADLNDAEATSSPSRIENPYNESEDPANKGLKDDDIETQEDEAFGENAGVFASASFKNSTNGPRDDDDDDDDDELIPVKDDDDDDLDLDDDDDDDDDDFDDSF
ncbi:MAG: hypothetical protein ABI390_04515 [Daejeonella sp.]